MSFYGAIPLDCLKKTFSSNIFIFAIEPKLSVVICQNNVKWCQEPTVSFLFKNSVNQGLFRKLVFFRVILGQSDFDGAQFQFQSQTRLKKTLKVRNAYNTFNLLQQLQRLYFRNIVSWSITGSIALLGRTVVLFLTVSFKLDLMLGKKLLPQQLTA